MHVRERKINATAFVAILAAAWAFVVPARVRAATFVKDVMLIGGRSLDMPALRVQYTSSGWTAVNSDLNEGTDGDRIYLLYKTAEHPGETAEFITGFYIDTVSTTNPPATHTVDGTTYHLVDFDGSDNFKNSKGDLNRGAGGDYIHLYYTKSVLPSGRAVASIEFNDTQSGAVAANGGNAPGYDLNKGCGSESAYIYMHLATEIFEYAIAYDLAGGSLPSGTSNPSSYNVETATFTLNEPSRPGYTFAGWTWQGQTTPTKGVSIPQGSTGDKSYTASWNANPVGNVDGCTGGKASLTVAGWAYDPDAPSQSIDVRIEVCQGDGATPCREKTVVADLPSDAANSSCHITGRHGFSATFENLAAGPYTVKVYAIDSDDGAGLQIGSTSSMTVSPYLSGTGTLEDPYLIQSAADWEFFASMMNAGSENDFCYRLTADIGPVTAMVGTDSHPFAGFFDGSGHTIDLAIVDTENQGTAPFRYIADAAVLNVKTTGSVTGGLHCAGLVGFAKGGRNRIMQCEVAARVVCGGNGENGLCGGVLGHGTSSSTIVRNCLFSGVIVGATSAAGAIYGSGGDGGTHTIENCMSAGTFTGCGAVDLLGTDKGRAAVVNCYRRGGGCSQGADAAGMPAAELLAALGTGWEIRGGNVLPAALGERDLALSTIAGLEWLRWTEDLNVASPVVGVESLLGDEVNPSCYSVTIVDRDGNIVTSNLAERASYTLTVRAVGGNAGAYTGSLSVAFTCPAVFFVDAERGDDANDGHSRTNAHRSIGKAIAVAGPGDAISVAGGVYAPIDVQGKRLTIIGADAASTIIDGGGSACCANLSSGTTLRGFTLRNGHNAVNGGTLERCVVENCTANLNAPVVSGGTHRNSIFRSLTGSIIFQDATLFNCTVVNCYANGFDGYDDESYTYRTVYQGYFIRGGARYNCIFWGNSYDAVWQFDPEEERELQRRGCSENDPEDPKFMAPDIGNYHLCADSPAIDSGDPDHAADAGDVDLDGSPRVQGGKIDRGCYEGVGGVHVATTVVGYGSVSPEHAWVQAPATITLTADLCGSDRPVVGWFTNGVLAASGGDTFTLSNVVEDIAVTVRFALVDWYVDSENGDDANNGLSSVTAMRTLRTALDAALRDDTIHLLPGTYPPIDDRGRRVAVVGAGADCTVIDGGGTNRCATLSGGATLRGFTLRNGYDNDLYGCGGVLGGGLDGGVLEDCVIEDCYGRWCGAVRGIETRRCIVRNIETGHDAVVGGVHRSSLFHGISAWRSVFTDTTLYNCTVANCAVGDNDLPWLFGDNLVSYNCIFWGNSYNNDAEDPLFAGAAVGDYRLRANSPAIDAGDPRYAREAGETDLSGDVRVQGAAIDRGCYEGSGVVGLVQFKASVEDPDDGTVTPSWVLTHAPATVTFSVESLQRIVRPVDGWFTNGVLAASGGDTFTLADWSDDVKVTVRFESIDLYVDAASGDDGNDGRSPATPFRTIQAAIGFSATRDTIHVAPGSYAPVNADRRGVIIIGAGAGCTVIDGGGTNRCATLSGGATLRGFTLRNGNDGDKDGCGGVLGGVLEDCVLEDCYGLWCGAVRDTETRRCIVRNIETGYEAVVGGVHRSSLFHGISARYSLFQDTTLYNCTVANNDSTYFGFGLTPRNCIFWGNSANFGNSYNNDAEDPMFVPSSDRIYRLRAGSPAIDAGDAAYADEVGETDIAGNPRVQGAAIDRGCYEGPGENGFVVMSKVEGRGLVSPDGVFVTNSAQTVTFTADTSAWGLPVTGWYTNDVWAAGAQERFQIGDIAEDVVVKTTFQTGNVCIYVDAAAGSDAKDGATPARALKTIQRAIDVSIPGDTIRVAAGTYGSIDVGGRSLTIIGAGADKTVIDGGRQRCATLAEGTTLRGFTLRNGYTNTKLYLSYPWDGTSACVMYGALEDCIVEDCIGAEDGAILFQTSTDRCVVRNCHAKEFVALYGVHRSSLFCRNQSDELEILYSVESYNCTFADNSAGFPFLLDGTIVNAIRWGNSTTQVGAVGVPPQNDEADPLFVDATNGNYRLRSGSPAINGGDEGYAIQAGSADLDGNPRVQGSSVDCGCYESPASTTGYSFWAWMWGLGAWNEKDASGVANVFRYIFDKPSGAFADTPLLSISFDANGKAVIHTPPPSPSATDFDISIRAADTPGGGGDTAYPLDPSGETVIPETGKPARFFRLKATER